MYYLVYHLTLWFNERLCFALGCKFESNARKYKCVVFEVECITLIPETIERQHGFQIKKITSSQQKLQTSADISAHPYMG